MLLSNSFIDTPVFKIRGHSKPSTRFKKKLQNKTKNSNTEKNNCIFLVVGNAHLQRLSNGIELEVRLLTNTDIFKKVQCKC